MQIKLDENLGVRGGQLIADAGHGVATVKEQGLTSAADKRDCEGCAINHSKYGLTIGEILRDVRTILAEFAIAL